MPKAAAYSIKDPCGHQYRYPNKQRNLKAATTPSDLPTNIIVTTNISHTITSKMLQMPTRENHVTKATGI